MALLGPPSATSAAPAEGAQASLDFSPSPARRERERRRPFKVDPRVKAALAVLIYDRHHGRAAGATWERLREELAETGLTVNHPRRLQEAVCDLRRVEKATIGATSRHGVFWIADDTDRKLAAAERVKRIRALSEELEALDLALYQRIAGALPLPEGGEA